MGGPLGDVRAGQPRDDARALGELDEVADALDRGHHVAVHELHALRAARWSPRCRSASGRPRGRARRPTPRRRSPAPARPRRRRGTGRRRGPRRRSTTTCSTSGSCLRASSTPARNCCSVIDDPRARVGDDVLDLLGRVLHVDRERRRPDHHRREVAEVELGPVGDQQGQRVALGQPERRAGRRRARRRARAAAPHVQRLLVVSRPDGDLVRALRGGDAEGLRDRRRAHRAALRRAALHAHPSDWLTGPEAPSLADPEALALQPPMSLLSPTANRNSTSMKPMTLARSMTLKAIARPRTFSASAQKMWPPSSGRNGNRLTIASDSEMTARMFRASTQPERVDDLARGLVGADDARDLLACLGVVEDPRDRAHGRLGDAPHAGDARAGRLDRALRVGPRRRTRSRPAPGRRPWSSAA